MTWFRAGGAGIPASLKSSMNAVLNKKFGTTGQNYPPKEWPDDVNLMGPLPEGTATGSVAVVTDGADRVPVKSWIINVDPNLTGKSQIVATQSGRNLLAKEIVGYTNSMADLSECFAIHHGTYTVTIGTVEDATNWRLSVLLMDANGNALTDNTYKPSNDLQLATNRWRYGSNTTTKSFTVNIVVDCYVRFFIELGDTSSSTTISNSFLEVGSTATSYEPYSAPVSNTVNLGQTIYGGTVDVVNGTGKTKVHKQTYTGDDLSSVSLSYGTSEEGYTHMYFYISGIPLAYNPSGSNVISDIGVPWSATASGSPYPSSECYRLMNTGSGANQRPTMYAYLHQTWASVDAFKTWLNANPITIVYEVADATDFTFTPITPTPETTLGVNNFWSDEGDTTVVYRRDIDLALQAVSSSRGLMMASRPVTQLIGEESDPDQVNELVENDETEQEGEDDAR